MSRDYVRSIGLWERLLETRIRLQKVLLLGNRLPQCETFSQFQNAGDQQVTMAIRESKSIHVQFVCVCPCANIWVSK